MDILRTVDQKAEVIKSRVMSAADIKPEGGARVFYVAQSGDDRNDGASPETAVRTLEKVNALVEKGNREKTYIRFKRGDIFRGQLTARDNTVYTAYGTGEKPVITVSPENGADPAKWCLAENSNNIWCFYRDMPDVGALFFENGGYAVKQCPDIVNGKYEFGTERLEDRQFICMLPEEQAKDLRNNNAEDITGKLYFRCDEGNPGEIFSSIEFAVRIYGVVLPYESENITVDNLHVDCVGAHGIGGGYITDLLVQNCEISNIGGGIMLYYKSATEDKYTVSRYGNGVELHSACNGYTVRNCYVHDIYDAGITHQQGTNHSTDLVFRDVNYEGNLIERCIYSIEYFARRSAGTNIPCVMENIRMADNIIRFAGHGFGAQRTILYSHWNMATSIMGWFTAHNVTRGGFVIENNILSHSTPSSPDRPLKQNTSTLLIAAEDKKYLPEMRGNTYIGLRGNQFAYFGENTPAPIPFATAEDGLSAEVLFGDKTGKIYIVEE